MNKIEILEYIRTIFIALLVALLLAAVATGCSKMIAAHHAKLMERISNTDKDNQMIGYLINKYTLEAQQNPGDYRINVKLGALYEMMFSYKQAEEQYQKGINKSPYGVYSPFFGLANLYIKEEKYNEALKTVKQLKNTDHIPLLIAKGDFYMNIGDALWQKNDYEQAVKQYKLAYFFYDKSKSKKKDIAVSNILDCYDHIADDAYSQNNTEKAVESLETALLYKESPVLYYKLALLYMDFDAVTANQYMEKVFKMDPGLINYDIYEELLLKLVTYYYENGDDINTDLYKQKLKSIKTFQKRYVITENDVKVNMKKLKISTNLFKNKNKINIKYTIENTSRYDFNSLFIIIKLKYDDKERKIFEQRYYSKKNPLKSRKESQEYKFKYSYSDKDDIYTAKKVYLQFYAGKKDNMRKIPIYSVEIKQK